MSALAFRKLSAAVDRARAVQANADFWAQAARDAEACGHCRGAESYRRRAASVAARAARVRDRLGKVWRNA